MDKNHRTRRAIRPLTLALTTTIDILLTVEALVSKITRLLRDIDPSMRVFQKLHAVALPFCSGVAKFKKYCKTAWIF